MFKVCCEGFRNLMTAIGDKGFAIIPKNEDGLRRFILQARPFDLDVLSYLSAIDPETGKNRMPELRDKTGNSVSMIVAMEVPLSYCPGCGKKLENVIESNIEEFDELAEKTKVFL